MPDDPTNRFLTAWRQLPCKHCGTNRVLISGGRFVGVRHEVRCIEGLRDAINSIGGDQ